MNPNTPPACARVDILFNMEYGRRYGARMARLLSRLGWLLRGAALVAGSAAAASLLGLASAQAVAWLSLLVAALAVADAVLDPAGQRATVLRHVDAINALRAEGPRLCDDELAARWLALARADLPELDGLREPVMRQTLAELGYPSPQPPDPPLSLWQRLLSAVA